MEVKIQCNCGSRYKFPVEPVSGHVPTPVQCPSCAADWTEAVNLSIRNQLMTAEVSQETPAPALATAAAVAKPAIRLIKPEHTPAPAAAPAVAVAGLHVPQVAHVAHAAAPPARPAAGRSIPIPATMPNPAKRWREPNLKRGIIGAVVSAIVAAVVWYLFIISTTINFSILAILVGVFIGIVSRMMSGGYAATMGLVCGLSAFVAIISAQYAATRALVMEEMVKETGKDYRREVKYAKRAVALGSDAEIRQFLARQEDFSPLSGPEDISDIELAAFRAELPKYQRLADGSLSEREYAKQANAFARSKTFNIIILFTSLGFWGIIYTCVGVGLAFKLGSGEMELGCACSWFLGPIRRTYRSADAS